MQITYENTFDHWVAYVLYESDCGSLAKIKKDNTKRDFRYIIYLIALDAFIFYRVGATPFLKFYTLLIFIYILYILFLRQTSMQKQIYHNLKIIQGQDFEDEKDKTVQWEVTPEKIIIKDSDQEILFPPNSIRKIIVCPQYLFLNFGLGSNAALPRPAVAEADYNTFCAYLIELYQAHAKQHEKEAAIIQSDWTVDIAALSAKASAKTSLKRIFFTLVWGLVFLTIGILFFGMLAFAVMILQTSTELLPCNIEALTPIVVGGLLIGSALFALTGVILGLRAKLPGTK